MKKEQSKYKKQNLRGNSIDPLASLNKKLVGKMYQGFAPDKAHKLMKSFKKKGATQKILLAGEENEEAILNA